MGSEQLGHTPSLSDTSAGSVGGVSIENFRDEADASVVQVIQEWLDHLLGLLSGFKRKAVDLQMSLNEGPNQPSPDGSLMIGAVSIKRVCVAGATVLVVFAVQATQAEGS